MTKSRLFLVTDNAIGSHGRREGFRDVDNRYIQRTIERVLGSGQGIVHQNNLPSCHDLLQERDFDGLIVPEGHGDYNTIRNLESYNGGKKIGVPVFEAYLHRPLTREEELAKWLTENFKSQDEPAKR